MDIDGARREELDAASNLNELSTALPGVDIREQAAREVVIKSGEIADIFGIAAYSKKIRMLYEQIDKNKDCILFANKALRDVIDKPGSIKYIKAKTEVMDLEYRAEKLQAELEDYQKGAAALIAA